jgi:quinol monooxygenase YgiN
MIINAGPLTIREGSMEAVLEALRTAIPAVLEEEGVLVYTFAVDIEDPNVVRVYEEYTDMAALASHGEEPHTKVLFGVLREHLDGRPGLKTYEAVAVERG